MSHASSRDELALEQINRELAELLDVAALPLERGGGRALGDALWVWGIVGGKDVGKSTLINALAGGEVVDRGEEVGEGTFVPSAYLNAGDLAALRARFEGLEDVGVRYVDRAPDGMRGLVLVDLPDFDSLFAHHLAAVRRIAGVLDGIIWVTTPKKVGDLRAIAEVDRILKARGNFAYVVNKMDWLIAQSAGPPQAELRRAAEALGQQVTHCDTDDGRARSFFVSARYRTRTAMVEAIARSRNADLAKINGAIAEAADALLRDFDALRERLTTAPTSDVAEANKRANLSYQSRTQAERMRVRYQPDESLARLDRVLVEDRLDELTTQYFSPAYCAAVLRRLNSVDALFGSWASALFRRRISRWPLLGAIAWPAMAIGAALAGVRALLPRFTTVDAPDPYRQDGVDLADRAEGVISGLRSRLASLGPRFVALLPEAPIIAQAFRADAQALANEQREAVLAGRMRGHTGVLGKFLRGMLTVGILLWFPFIQPMLAAWLATMGAGGAGAMEALKLLVQTLSGSAVLSGLCVSALLLIGMTGAVYARAAADAYRALDQLRDLADDEGAAALGAALAATATRDPRAVREQLAAICDRLQAIASRS